MLYLSVWNCRTTERATLYFSTEFVSLYFFWLFVLPLNDKEVLGLFDGGVGADVVCIQNILFEILCGGCIIISVDVVSHLVVI